jgi:predicted acetylornithine/succinylornithine family transaminase
MLWFLEFRSGETPTMNAATGELFRQHVIPNYNRYPVCIQRGAGSRVWDDQGREYIDFFPGWGCAIVGHCPPRVVEAVKDQVGRLIHVPNSWHTEPQGRLAKALTDRTGWGGQAFFCNSGAEAIEASLKLARLWGQASGKHRIVAMLNSFHGRTMGALSATGQPKYHQGVHPLVPGFSHASYGNLEEVDELIGNETCAVLLETIQGEGGINIPPDGYLEGLREITRRKGCLLILDEVQSGMGRVGSWYAHQLWNIQPDIITLAKALASGVPCGGIIATPEVASFLKPGTHASTYGGNPLSCAAALATIATIEEEGLLERAKVLEQRFRERFQALSVRCPWITEVRARGVMIGIELAVYGTPVVGKCLEKGLLVNCTHQTVIRLLPAMNLTDSDFEAGCAILEEAIAGLIT